MLEKHNYLHNLLKGLIADTSPVSLICLLRDTARKEAQWAETEEERIKWSRKERLLDSMLSRFEEVD
ncbi:hypothetical protein Sta7437_1706 [Stanieria cyanosphaera PCC 7437]|uniref:Uncharacterized protein n=1 Tax=Stanieria cyanosphaera (strain ATCC 29371 / PCC 7437) TaxID=111780 RepID=K9XRW7_STAC7|nr:hypothetical protein [Stanieria cyanosphaera]AFZ35268.1 hypothetical protein Sta7437_1706 [Stanieria cyanosphaera PCC 7437]